MSGEHRATTAGSTPAAVGAATVQAAAAPLVRTPGIIEEDFPGEVLLYDPASAQAFTLNTSARAIWDLVDGKRSVTEIARVLGQQFGCPAEALFEDVTAAVTQFGELGLVVTR